MAWPSSDVNTSNVDAGTDKKQLARADFFDLITQFNLLRNHVSAFMRGFLSSEDATIARTAIGATTVGGNLLTAVDAAAARTALSISESATYPTELALWESASPSSVSGFVDVSLGALMANIGNRASGSTFITSRAGYVRIQVVGFTYLVASGSVSYCVLGVKRDSSIMNTVSNAANESQGLYTIIQCTAGQVFRVSAAAIGGGTANIYLRGISFEML